MSQIAKPIKEARRIPLQKKLAGSQQSSGTDNETSTASLALTVAVKPSITETDPTELPSEQRRKQASRKVASAIANIHQRNQDTHSNRFTVPQREDDENLIDFEEVDIDPVTPTQDKVNVENDADDTSRSSGCVKPVAEVIEIESDSDNDVQIVSPPPSISRCPKRSRTSSSLPTSSVDTDGHAPSKRAKRRPRSATAVYQNDTTSVLPNTDCQERPILKRDEPWPQHFVKLEQTFKALNTIYSFCSARKHMETTYDNIKSSVEGLLKRSLEIFDVAQIKSLCGDLIHFAYIEHALLQAHMDSRANAQGLPNTARKKAKSRNENIQDVYEKAAASFEPIPPLLQGPTDASGFAVSGGGFQDQAEADSGGGPTELELPTQTKGKERERDVYVLLFEFNDGTLPGPKATTRGRSAVKRGVAKDGSNLKSKLNSKLSSTPSTESMIKLINKRNVKFEQAVLELLAACKAKEQDPVQLVIEAAHDHVPLNPATADTTEMETPKRKRNQLEFLMQNPDCRAGISEIIKEMKETPWWKQQIVPGGHQVFDARQVQYAPLNYRLTQAVVNAVYATKGIQEFYTHQAEALNALHQGQNVIVSTSTSSGKSLIYQLPVLQALEKDIDSTALYIFPTKALAQDQRRSLQELLANCEGLEDVVVATYDGDTESELRRDVRERASVIFTNPDMLHQSILPSEDRWRRFLRNLKFVVIDELHTYNGLFGAHVSFIMRRLRRICRALGNEGVQFVSCSATVSNPKEHMQTLFGVREVHVVTEDGSPSGRKEWLVWNPPYIDETDPGQGRVSGYAEASRVFRHLIQRGVRTILFTKVRKTCEIVMRQVRNDLLLEDQSDVANRIMSYRSGYSAQDRRKIEQDMFKGQLLGIVATSALELGIDIGSLDAVIMLGFPYSISSLRQQAGRAGRRQKDSLAVLIGDPWPMDQHFMQFPDELFHQPDAALSVDLENDFVLESHLQCAAQEMPIRIQDDSQYFGDRLSMLCKTRLETDGSGFYHCRQDLGPNPSRHVAIRGTRQVTYSYVDDSPGQPGEPRVMEEVEVERALFEAFQGAVFMHQGLSYICKEINHDTRIARMIKTEVNYHTRLRSHTDIDIDETDHVRQIPESQLLAYYGKLTIKSYVWGYFKIDQRANILDTIEIVDYRPLIQHTQGVWIDIPISIIQTLTDQGLNVSSAIHSAEHALLSLTPLFVISVTGEIRTECRIIESKRLLFYDTPGQNGRICYKIVQHIQGLLQIAIHVIETCSCLDGCFSCVFLHTCSSNQVSDGFSKKGALVVLRGIIGRGSESI